MRQYSIFKVIFIEILVYLDNNNYYCESQPLLGFGHGISGDDKGSGHNSFPLTHNSNSIISTKTNNNNGNALSVSTRGGIKKRSLLGVDGSGSDFKSLVHGLESNNDAGDTADDERSSGDVLNVLPLNPTGASNIVAPNNGNSNVLNEITELTNLIGTSLKALESASELASNSTTYLQTMLATVQKNSDGLIQQLDVLKNLSIELGNVVAKPLREIQPLVETQIEFATTISSSIMKIIDTVQQLEKTIENLVKFAPLLLFTSLSSNCISLIILLCLLCNCISLRKIRRNQDEDLRIERPSIQHTLPFPFRNVEMDEMNLRNSLRTHM